MLYVYEGCCGNTSHERRCRLAEYTNDPTFSCPRCGRLLKQWITAPRLVGTKSFEPFKSTVDGSIIRSRRELEEHNRRNKVMNIHDGYSEKEFFNKINEDLYADKNKELTKDVLGDVKESIQKLNEGYKPTTAPEGEIIP